MFTNYLEKYTHKVLLDWKTYRYFMFFKKKVKKKLTARSSRLEKMHVNWARSGIINSKKNGKASEAFVDLTTHKITRHINWIRVNRCIFAVFTYKKNEKKLLSAQAQMNTSIMEFMHIYHSLIISAYSFKNPFK